MGGGRYRTALHTVSGGLMGGVGGAVGAATVATMADQLNALQFQTRVALVEQGMSPEAAKLVAQGLAELTSIGIGSVVGGTAGAATSLCQDPLGYTQLDSNPISRGVLSYEPTI
jgi:filamentous hemagglutinin